MLKMDAIILNLKLDRAVQGINLIEMNRSLTFENLISKKFVQIFIWLKRIIKLDWENSR